MSQEVKTRLFRVLTWNPYATAAVTSLPGMAFGLWLSLLHKSPTNQLPDGIHAVLCALVFGLVSLYYIGGLVFDYIAKARQEGSH